MMSYKLIAPTAFAIALGAAAPGFAQPKPMTVRNITVTEQLDSTQGHFAAAHWEQLPERLKDAIAARLDGRQSPQGVDLKIVITADHVPVGSGRDDGNGALTGRVFVMQPGKASNRKALPVVPVVLKTYELTITSQEAKDALPPPGVANTTAPASSQYQNAMVTHFANYVVRHI